MWHLGDNEHVRVVALQPALQVSLAQLVSVWQAFSHAVMPGCRHPDFGSNTCCCGS